MSALLFTFSPHPTRGLLSYRLQPERSSLLWRKKREWLRLASICRPVLRARIKKGPPSSTVPSLQPGLLPAETATPLMAPHSLYPPPLPAAPPLTLFHQRKVKQEVKIKLHQAQKCPKTLLSKIHRAAVTIARLLVRHTKNLKDRIRMFLKSSLTRLKTKLKTGSPTKEQANITFILSSYPPHTLWNLAFLQHLPLASPELFQNLAMFYDPLQFGQVPKAKRVGCFSRTTLWLVQRGCLCGPVRQRRERNPGQCNRKFLPLSRACPIPPPACRCRVSCQATRKQPETPGSNLPCPLHLSPAEWDYLPLS